MLEGAQKAAKAAPEAGVVCSGLSFLGTFAPHVAAAGIRDGWFSFAGFGRQSFSYPDLARDILREGRMREDCLCLTCGKCTELMRAGKTPGCVIYDRDVYTKLYAEIRK